MSFIVKLRHLDRRPNGTLRFRRRFPQDCHEAIGRKQLQVTLKSRSGAKVQIEHEAIMRTFDQLVATAEEGQRDSDSRSPIAKWHDALLKAEGLLEGVSGLDETDARGMIGEDLTAKGADPLLIKAMFNPDAAPPKATLQDAVRMYLDLRIKDNRQKQVQFELVVGRLVTVLGPLEDLALVELRREHGRKIKDHLLSLRKPDGTPLALESVRRNLTTIKAMVNLGITELDLDGKASNPFAKLELPKSVGRKSEKRQPLPDAVVQAVRTKLDGITGNDALRLSWRLMAGTSAHAKEVTFLELKDINIASELIEIRANNLRGELKTDARDRAIPLVGEALAAAKEIVQSMKGQAATSSVFPRYSKHERSADTLTANLNKHIKSVTDEKGLTTYGLRHRVSAKLRLAGAPQETIDRILGHSIEAIGASTYGGDERLTVDRAWMVKAGL